MDTVRDYIINDLHRGGTYLQGKGLYQGNERNMIYVTLERPDMVKLRAKLHELDPQAFVNVVDSSSTLLTRSTSTPRLRAVSLPASNKFKSRQ